VDGELKVFSGNANPELSKAICDYLGIPIGELHLSTFSDGEIYCQIMENVRGKDVFIIQPTCPPVNHNLMELLVMLDAFSRASAGRITAVIPYYGYARQDRKDKPRVPISAKLVADLLSAAGANRILALDLHAPQIQGFFDIPVDHLFSTPVAIDYIKKKGVLHIIGEVEGKNAFIIDDMIDTAGTMVKTAKALLENGAKAVYAYGTHPVFSGPALDRLESSEIVEVVVTNSIPLSEKARASDKIVQLSVAPLLGEAIRRIHRGDSVSSLFV